MVDTLDDDNIKRLIAERKAKNEKEGLLFSPTNYLIAPSSQSNSRDTGAIFGEDMQDLVGYAGSKRTRAYARLATQLRHHAFLADSRIMVFGPSPWTSKWGG